MAILPGIYETIESAIRNMRNSFNWVWVCALMALAGSASQGQAGTTGGLYDFRLLMNAPHPFSPHQPTSQAPAIRQPAAAPATVAPPPPILRYTPVPSPARATTSAPAIRAAPQPVTDVIRSPSPPPVQNLQTANSSTLSPRTSSARYDPNKDGLLGWLSPWFQRPYISASIGAARVSSRIQETGNGAGDFAVDYDWKFGVNGDVGAGWYFGESYRAEANVGYWFLPLDSAIGGGDRTGGDGDFTAITFMLNGFYDYELSPDMRPFIGAGLGVIQIDVDDIDIAGREVTSLDAAYFAYQGIVGMAWNFQSNAAFTIDYRFLDSTADDVTLQRLNLGIRLEL